MNLGYLADHFDGVAAKVLSAVETVGKRSNQHEIDGVHALRKLFGSPLEKLYIPCSFLWLDDDMEDPVVEEGHLTFYDARINVPNRSEYRLYYPAHIEAMTMAQPGDVVFIAKRRTGHVLLIVVPGDSSIASQLDWLFGTEVLDHRGFSLRPNLERGDDALGLPAMYLLDMLGVAVEPTDDSVLEQMLEKFGAGFPPSAQFGAFARSTLPGLHPRDDADGVLLAWMEKEEILFRTLERHLATDTLGKLYADKHVDVDRFIEVSLSMHNRRKSRAGRGLENQLIALFSALDVQHVFNPVTENRSRPDFVFPSIDAYHNRQFPVGKLTMLGVKTTCKDRWRQVLSEAQRIPDKHLLTFETPISKAQTDEMREHRVQLVVPRDLQDPYSADQRQWLMNVSDLVALIRGREK